MADLSIILPAAMQVFAIVGIGAFCRHRKWLDPSADTGLTKLIINVLFPALIIDMMLDNPALLNPRNLVVAPLIGFGVVILGFGLCRLVAPLLGLKERKAAGSFAFTAGIYNYGFIPIPLCAALFDERTMGVLFVNNVGVEVALWSVGLVLLTGGRFSIGSLRKLINPPLVTVVCAVVLTVSGLAPKVPVLVTNVCGMVGACSIPMALIMTGALIYDVADPALYKGQVKVGLGAVVMRQLLIPLIMLGMMVSLPLEIEMKRVLMLHAAMPSGVFPIVLARHYPGHLPTTVRVVLATNVSGIITVPLWVAFGMGLL